MCSAGVDLGACGWEWPVEARKVHGEARVMCGLKVRIDAGRSGDVQGMDPSNPLQSRAFITSVYLW